MASTAASRHVVAVPYPGRGHINPMLAVCRLLAAADDALAVTVVVTEEWHALLASAGVPPTLPDRVRFATIPNVIPSERDRGADHAGFFEAVHTKMAEPVERLLDRLVLERRPEAIVADTYLTWGLAAGARRGIPVCSLWTMAATFFLALYHYDLWPPVDGREGEQAAMFHRPPQEATATQIMASTAASRHVVAVPFPGRGHINPMLAVCRLLAAADDALAVTVVVTEEWHALLASAGVPHTLPDRVRFANIPNVIPSERDRGADHNGFLEAVHTNMVEPVERLLDRLVLERRPEAIVADTNLTWGLAAGARRGIPVCSLWTMAATFFLALYHYDLWPPVDGREGEQELSCKSLEQYVPGVSSVRLSDIKIFRSSERPMKLALESFANVRKAQCVLFTSFYDLEPCAINRITRTVPCPIYPIGPSIPHMPLKGDSGKINNEEHSNWLDVQPKNSVLYISFGSYVSMSPLQLEEIAMGLQDSALRFFWVARDKATGLQQMCGDKGLVVPWCDQLKVLCHPSVGGFLSHCGWNSMLEAACAGVPLLAFPVAWDQLVNGRILADEWKIGINLREQRREDGIISRGAISAAATKLMDLDNGDNQEMRKRAAELCEASRSAVQEDGSSHRSLNGFVKDLIEGRLNVAETSQLKAQ